MIGGARAALLGGAAAPIEFVAAAYGQQGPAATQPGDLLLVVAGNNVPPPGWVEQARSEIFGGQGSGGYVGLYSRVAQPGDAGTVFGFADVNSPRGILLYRNVDTVAPFDVAAAVGWGTVTGAGGQVTAPGVSTAGANTRLLTVHYVPSFGAGGFSPPAGMTERFDATQVRALAVNDETRSAPGPTGTRSAQIAPLDGSTFTNYGYATITAALRPAA